MQLSRWSSPFALLALATAFLSFSAVAANDPRLKSLGRDACDGGCNACEGDCDVDSDCDGNLKCFQRGRKESVPGCSKKGRRGWDYCYNDSANPNPTRQPTNAPPDNGGLITTGRDGCGSGGCGECEGDCDSDSQCSGNLECFQRDESDEIPGCGGGGRRGWDYCFIPNSSSAPIKNLGQNACYNGNCNICEGDCDFDSDCAGNLKCYQRDSLMSSVPGCTGETYGAWDYCYNDNSPPTPNPPPTPSPTSSPTKRPTNDNDNGKVQVKYGGHACRRSNGGNGNERQCEVWKSGDYYKIAGWTFNECEQFCRLDFECKAIEYDAIRQHCEVWTTYPALTSKQAGFQCYKFDDPGVAPAPAPAPAPPTPGPPNQETQCGGGDGPQPPAPMPSPGAPVLPGTPISPKSQSPAQALECDGHVCQTLSGGNGNERKCERWGDGDYYKLALSEDDCFNQCEEDVDCKAFEYKYDNGITHCKIWTTYPNNHERKDSFDCYKKEEEEGFDDCVCARSEADYRGSVAKTVSGRTCQRWDRQAPHSHTRTSSNYPDAGLDSNYCRNPDGWTGLWCYTTDPDQRWELCDIPCYARDRSDYRGSNSVTVSGRTCQRWDEQSPHSHTRTPGNYPSGGLASNHCRNPDGDKGLWCHTTDPNVFWEYCDIPSCPNETRDCVCASDGSDYRGHTRLTVSGKECQRWDSQFPHTHSMTADNYPDAGLESNYCRNPNNSQSGPYCYTTDPDVEFELCDIPSCGSDGSEYRGSLSKTRSGRTCQRWDMQSPHTHTKTPENLPNGGLEDNNYCRNPDEDKGLWCHTTDPNVVWEYCDNPACPDNQGKILN